MEVALGFLVGIITGSFISATSERLIKNQSILGRSRCKSCKHTLNAYDLFPIVSLFFLKGRCRYCHKSIPQELLWTELLAGGIVALFTLLHPPFANYLTLLDWLFGVVVIAILLLVALIDFKIGLILDKISLPSSLAVGIYLISRASYRSWISYSEFLTSSHSNYLLLQLQGLWLPVGLSFITGIGLALFFIFLIIVTKGKGMGWGDVKYVLFLGLALGFPGGILAIFLAFLLGALISIALIFLKYKKLGATVPFGPFLSLGALITLLWGDRLLNWYLQLAR